MKFLPLVWRNLLRRKVRSTFTLLSIVVAFVLFGYLSAIRVAFGMGVDVAGADRMLVIHKVSLIQPLPESYFGRIAATAGVEDVSHMTWFGGIYQDPRNFFAQFAVDPESYLRIYPELGLTDEEKQRWLANRTGAIADRATAERFGWSVGDRIPLQGTIWRARAGATWEFTIEAIIDGSTGSARRSSCFTTSTWRKRTSADVAPSVSTSSASTTRRARQRSPPPSIPASPTRRPRRGRRPSRPSCRASRTSSGTSARC